MSSKLFETIIGLIVGNGATLRRERQRTFEQFQRLPSLDQDELYMNAEVWAAEMGGSVTGEREANISFLKPWKPPNHGITFRYREMRDDNLNITCSDAFIPTPDLPRISKLPNESAISVKTTATASTAFTPKRNDSEDSQKTIDTVASSAPAISPYDDQNLHKPQRPAVTFNIEPTVIQSVVKSPALKSSNRNKAVSFSRFPIIHDEEDNTYTPLPAAQQTYHNSSFQRRQIFYIGKDSTNFGNAIPFDDGRIHDTNLLADSRHADIRPDIRFKKPSKVLLDLPRACEEGRLLDLEEKARLLHIEQAKWKALLEGEEVRCRERCCYPEFPLTQLGAHCEKFDTVEKWDIHRWIDTSIRVEADPETVRLTTEQLASIGLPLNLMETKSILQDCDVERCKALVAHGIRYAKLYALPRIPPWLLRKLNALKKFEDKSWPRIPTLAEIASRQNPRIYHPQYAPAIYYPPYTVKVEGQLNDFPDVLQR